MLRDLGLEVCNYSACHCEERSDEAIPFLQSGDCFATLAMTPFRAILNTNLPLSKPT